MNKSIFCLAIQLSCLLLKVDSADEEKEVGFKETWEFIPTKNKKLTELHFLGKEYTVMFEMIINKITSTYDSVLHIGLGGNAGVYGDRIPAFFIKNTKELHLASSINGNKNFWVAPPGGAE